MDIGFFFNDDNLIVQLPINPPDIEVSYSGNNKTSEVIKLGEINRLRNRKLADIKFNSWFPFDTWFPGIRTKGKFESCKYYKDFFTELMNSEKPVRFIVTGIDINMLVSVEDFNFTHKAGEGEDAYYSLVLKEYKDYKVKESNLQLKTTDKEETKVQEVKVEQKRKDTQITIGSPVILNGRVHIDSYGGKPGKLFTDYTCRVSLINKRGTHIYHITTPEGSPLGWVKKDQVKLK